MASDKFQKICDQISEELFPADTELFDLIIEDYANAIEKELNLNKLLWLEGKVIADNLSTDQRDGLLVCMQAFDESKQFQSRVKQKRETDISSNKFIN